MLCQLRTGKCRLNYYLNMIQTSDTASCDCGAPETIDHFLLECRRWTVHREKLRKAAGNRWGDFSYLLGGWCDRRKPDGKLIDGTRESWKPAYSVVAATLDFARAT